MKEKIKNFLSTNCITIPMFISLACIAIWDSTSALVIYVVTVHILTLALIIGLWVLEDIKLQSRSILFRIIQAFIIVVILVMTEHWYVLCVSIFYIFMVFVYLYDWAKDESTK